MRLFLALIFSTMSFAALADVEKPVDLAIVVSFDRSESIDRQEARAQINGLAYALRHPRYHAAIATGYHQRIALSVVTWSSFGRQEVIMPWIAIAGPDQAKLAAKWLEKFLDRKADPHHGSQTAARAH